MTPSKTTYNQVLAAIKRVIQNTTILADTGTANAYSAVNVVPLVSGSSQTWIDGVVQAVKIAHANTGASTYAPDGLTAILMRTTISTVNSGNPICILMECAGGAQQVPPATQSQHAMQLGQAVGRLLNIQYLTGSGTYTPTTGTTSIVVELLGGGGAGGGAPAVSSTYSCGGGAGCYLRKRLTASFSGVFYSVGAGGTGASGASGGTGGTTTFSSYSAAGGSGGATAGPAGATTYGMPLPVQEFQRRLAAICPIAGGLDPSVSSTTESL